MEKLGKFFQAYSLEENNYKVHVSNFGYFTYLVNGEEFFVETIYIDPPFRNAQRSLVFLKEMKSLAKSNGCSRITGTTYMLDPRENAKFTRKARLMIDAGFKMQAVQEKTIIWVMEV